jgi:hypothetical protein
LKWILGILAVLVIIGAMLVAVFVWWNHAPLGISRRFVQAQPNATPVPNGQPAPNGQNGPTTPYGFQGDHRFYFQGRGFNRPMMGGRVFGRMGGFAPFGFGLFLVGGLLRLIIPLAVLALVALLFYQLGKRAGASAGGSTPPSSNLPTPPPGRKVAKI